MEYQALRSGRLQGKLAHHGLITLHRLSGDTGQLPDNYLVNRGPGFQFEETDLWCHFAYVRRGKLGDKAVAVKTIFMTKQDNLSQIRKVRTLTSVQVLPRYMESEYRTFARCLCFG